MGRQKVWITVIGLAVLGGTLALGAGPEDPAISDLSTQLKSQDDASVTSAVNEIHTRLESDPDATIGYLRQFWLKDLKDAGRFDLVNAVSLQAILAAPYRTWDIEFFQEARVRALLSLSKPQDALLQAKALFNVAGMRTTERTLLLLAECLAAVHPRNPQILQQLAHEQKNGATTRPVSDAPAEGGIVASITVDGTAYQKAIEEFTSDDDRSQLAKGNLLLLAGRAQEAQVVFEKLLRHTDSSKLMDFRENIARAIRARDGTIGRANGYLLQVVGDDKGKP